MGCPNFFMLMWWVMIHEVIPHFWLPGFQYTKKSFCFNLSFIKENCISIVLYLLCLAIAVTIPSTSELSFLVGVVGWLNQVHWEWCGGVQRFYHCETFPRLLLWPHIPPHVSVFWIFCGLVHLLGVAGLEIFQVRLVSRWGISALQCVLVPMFWRGMIHHHQCVL